MGSPTSINKTVFLTIKIKVHIPSVCGVLARAPSGNRGEHSGPQRRRQTGRGQCVQGPTCAGVGEGHGLRGLPRLEAARAVPVSPLSCTPCPPGGALPADHQVFTAERGPSRGAFLKMGFCGTYKSWEV